jgi:hypothetical protein
MDGKPNLCVGSPRGWSSQDREEMASRVARQKVLVDLIVVVWSVIIHAMVLVL